MATTTTIPGIDIEKIREQFPVLNQQVNGRDLVYFDNAATSQKPLSVINALVDYYTGYNANIHRGIHTLAEKATRAYELTRETLREFINAKNNEEIIFTRGVTESINLVASSYGRAFLQAGDEVIISGLEHHSNIVPWQIVCEERKAVLKVIPITAEGEIDLDAYRKLLSTKTKVVAVNHASNSLGTINPVKEIIRLAHEVGAVALIDGAQAGAHLEINVQEIDCDFYCLSAHKMYGPTGTGILYGKRALLEKMPPYQGGGDMIKHVTFEKTTYNELPFKFEAGTPNIEAGICISVGIDYLNAIGIDAVAQYEHELLEYVTAKLQEIPGLKIIGTAENKASVVSFIIEGTHPSDVGVLLDKMGIAVRTGHHCTQPLMEFFGIPGTVRASLAFCNTKQEMDQLVDGVKRAVAMLL